MSQKSLMSAMYASYLSEFVQSHTDYERNATLPQIYDASIATSPLRVAGGAIDAMVYMFTWGALGRLRVGVNKDTGEIFCEIPISETFSVFEPSKVLLLNFDGMAQSLSSATYDAETKQLIPHVDVPTQYLIPHFIYQRLTAPEALSVQWTEVVANMSSSGGRVMSGPAADTILEREYYLGKTEIGSIMTDAIDFLNYAPADLEDVTERLFGRKVDADFFRDVEANLGIVFDGVAADAVSESSEEKVANARNKMEVLRNEVFPIVESFYQSLSDEDKALVPSDKLADGYIPTQTFEDTVHILADSLQRNDMEGQNILLMGPPGVGKSMMAMMLAYVFRMPYRFTQGYKTMDASEYRGTTIARDGVLHTNTDTPFANTVRRGGVFCDDDNNYSNEGENTVKNSVLIEPFELPLADQTVIKRHPFSIFVMTANPTQRGARPINEAVKDRHCIIIDLEPLSDAHLQQMVMQRTGYEDAAIVSRMIECWHLINSRLKDGDEDGDELTPRTLVNWARQTRILGDTVRAAKYNLLGALCGDETLRRDILNTVIMPRFPRQ